jgi:hypothetical protein
VHCSTQQDAVRNPTAATPYFKELNKNSNSIVKSNVLRGMWHACI